MNNDYKNFVERMGSFEDVIDLDSGNIDASDSETEFKHSNNESKRRVSMWQYNYAGAGPNELMHFGKKGMKWGRRTTKTTLANGGQKKVTTSKFTPWTEKTRTIVKNPGQKKDKTVELNTKFNGESTKEIYRNKADGSRSSVVKTKGAFKNSTTITSLSKEQVNNGRIYLASQLAIGLLAR